MAGIGMQELVVIFLIALLLFGATRIPAIGRSLGQGIREFKKSVGEISKDSGADRGAEKRG